MRAERSLNIAGNWGTYHCADRASGPYRSDLSSMQGDFLPSRNPRIHHRCNGETNSCSIPTATSHVSYVTLDPSRARKKDENLFKIFKIFSKTAICFGNSAWVWGSISTCCSMLPLYCRFQRRYSWWVALPTKLPRQVLCF